MICIWHSLQLYKKRATVPHNAYRKIRGRGGLPLYHLDLLYWNADRTVVPRTVFLERLHHAIAPKGVTAISLEATDMERSLYEKNGFEAMKDEMELLYDFGKNDVRIAI